MNFLDKKVVALLTGRGNNTLRDKNMLQVKGRPLLHYPCIEAKKVKEISDYYVSSEDEGILNAAFDMGFEKIKRPKKYALSDSKHVECLTHALSVMKS